MSSENHCFWSALLSFVLFLGGSAGLTSDGILLLSFKYSILSDPLSVLQSWDYGDATPCAWNGVACAQIGEVLRVTGLVLPRSQLLGSISPDLGLIEHLRYLDLSDNFFNGSLPESIFNAAELEVLALGNNVISGEIPEPIGGLKSLKVLNLSDNALSGKLPGNLSDLRNLTIVYLRSNYFSGSLPVGVGAVEELDLSSNLINGSLPLDFGGENLRYLNCSYNKISGSIPVQFAKTIPENATIDLSFNNLIGAIPESTTLLKQKTETFDGNEGLCGKPLKTICSIPSTLSTPPNTTTISPAIAVIPKSTDSNEDPRTPDGSTQSQKQSGGMNPATIAGIAIGDLAGITVLALIILYVYQLRKKKRLKTLNPTDPITTTTTTTATRLESKQNPSTEPNTSAAAACSSCLTFHGEETSEATSSETDRDDQNEAPNFNQKGGSLVALDGETELEPETLFTASAYVLGSSWCGIVYRAVLEDGTALAVRRIGAESAVGKVKDFESRVKAIAKIRHPNIVRVRGFYLGQDEKLIIHDYISNGSLAATTQRKVGSSSMNMSLDVRLKIARGVARGLAYIHEKKCVHGNVKPSNILLKSDMEPMISDFGLDKLVSARQHDLPTSSNSSMPEVRGVSPYRAPEARKNLKPNPKWDMYSFGLVLLELLTGRVFTEDELAQWATTEEKSRVLGLSDVTMIADVESREETMLTCFKLGFSCASLVPQKRPPMREVLQVLEKVQ